MRVLQRPESDKMEYEIGKIYEGVIDNVEFIDHITSSGQKIKGLKLWVTPKNENYRRIAAFDWIGEDEDGIFIFADSKMEIWLKRIFNIDSLSKVKLSDTKGKSCLYTVGSEEKRYKDKTGKESNRVFYHINEILPLKSKSVSNETTVKTENNPIDDDWGDDGEQL